MRLHDPIPLPKVPVRRIARRASGPLMVAGIAASASAYVVAGTLLHGGPTMQGYDVLMLATDLAITTAAFAAAVQLVLALAGAPATRARAMGAGLLAVTTAVPVAALVSLGAMMSNLEPLAQPIHVNSLLLAMWGVGTELIPIPVMFAWASALIALSPVIRRRVTLLRSTPAARTGPLGAA